ncbi:MAG: hypothetical protein QM773_14790 [Hyphomonadaceae bacterium]
MKTILMALVAATAIAAAPAIAQPPADTAAAPAIAAAAGKVSVQTTKISEIIKNPAAKATLEKAMPPIAQYYDQIAEMTLVEVMPMSQGQITEESLKALQAEFDKLP